MSKVPMTEKHADILVVEDNEGDVELLRAGIEEAGLDLTLHHVETGEECMAFLRKQGEHAGAPTPSIILLDLNLPAMDGREVMAEISADEQLNHLPVVVLTTSAGESDILRMYKMRCSSYIVKPIDFSQFVHLIRNVASYWFGVVVLPRQEGVVTKSGSPLAKTIIP